MRLENHRLNLFADVKSTSAPRTNQLVMSADALLKWKSRILAHQQQLRQAQSPQQTALSKCRITIYLSCYQINLVKFLN